MCACVRWFVLCFFLSVIGRFGCVGERNFDVSHWHFEFIHSQGESKTRKRESRFRIFEIHTAKQIICGWMLLAFGAVARLRTDGDTMYSWISRVALLFVYCVCQFVKIRWFSISFVAFPIPSNEFSGINFPNCHCQNKFSLFHSISLIYNELHSIRKKSIRFQLLTIA